MASSGRRQSRFHGRIEGHEQPCAHPGCTEPGEFRAPAGRGPSFDGPGEWRWLCLDHVREFNARYNWFDGMTADEISAAQNPYGGWDRETRAFASNGADRPPRWADFSDPLDAISGRARSRRSRGFRAERDGFHHYRSAHMGSSRSRATPRGGGRRHSHARRGHARSAGGTRSR